MHRRGSLAQTLLAVKLGIGVLITSRCLGDNQSGELNLTKLRVDGECESESEYGKVEFGSPSRIRTYNLAVAASRREPQHLGVYEVQEVFQ